MRGARALVVLRSWTGAVRPGASAVSSSSSEASSNRSCACVACTRRTHPGGLYEQWQCKHAAGGSQLAEPALPQETSPSRGDDAGGLHAYDGPAAAVNPFPVLRAMLGYRAGRHWWRSCSTCTCRRGQAVHGLPLYPRVPEQSFTCPGTSTCPGTFNCPGTSNCPGPPGPGGPGQCKGSGRPRRPPTARQPGSLHTRPPRRCLQCSGKEENGGAGWPCWPHGDTLL